MPASGDPTAQTLLGHLTDRAGAHDIADLSVDERGLGEEVEAALNAQYAPSPAVDGDVADVLAIASLSPLVTEWVPQSGGGGGVTLEQVQDDLGNTSLVAGTGITKTYNDGAGTITIGVTASTYQPLDSDLTTIAAANNGSVLAATTASFLTADETKLDGIEALADVTDATNVAAAGAVMESAFPSSLSIALSDMTTQITTGTTKAYWVNPYDTALTITKVKATLATAGSGSTVVDINEGAGTGTSILSTKITIDASDTDSDDATTPPVVSDASIAADGRLTFDIDTAGTSAAGLMVHIMFTRVV
jgi:hypothetical protein